jgi:hypothetical protein
MLGEVDQLGALLGQGVGELLLQEQRELLAHLAAQVPGLGRGGC